MLMESPLSLKPEPDISDSRPRYFEQDRNRTLNLDEIIEEVVHGTNEGIV